jgi:hypothetical protein
MRLSFAPCLALVLLCGCDEDALSSSGLSSTTAVAVEPGQFLGSVPCSNKPGAMRSYTLTLLAYDDETDTTPFRLPTSAPTPCAHGAAFREGIVAGKRYTAEIAGYEQSADELEPFGGAFSGSSTLLDKADGQTVPPRWSTTCGSGALGASVAQGSSKVLVPDCLELFDSSSSGTQLHVDPVAVLGSDPCSTASGFDLLRANPSDNHFAEQLDVACDAAPFALALQGVQPFEVYARTRQSGAGQNEPLLAALCTVTPESGTASPLRCNPLVAHGNVRIQLGSLSDNGAARCPVGGYFFVRQGQQSFHSLPLPCGDEALLGPLDAGIYSLTIDIFDATHEAVDASTQCAVEVEAGKSNPALCL